MFMRTLVRLAPGFALLPTLADQASANMLQLNTLGNRSEWIQGTWSESGTHLPPQLVQLGFGGGAVAQRRENQRGYLNYDFSSYAWLVSNYRAISAELKFEGNSLSTDCETVGVFDVKTSIDQLQQIGRLDTTVYDDLGSGTMFGAFELGHSQLYSFTVPLNESAVAAINQNLRGSISFGLSLLTVSARPTKDELLVLRQNSPQLTITVQYIPEPATAALMAFAAPAVFLRRRRRAAV